MIMMLSNSPGAAVHRATHHDRIFREPASQLDFPGLLKALRASALATGVFPLGGIRVRAYQADHYLIADGHPANAFVQ